MASKGKEAKSAEEAVDGSNKMAGKCFVLYMFVLFFPGCLGTFDLNPLQIQYVADHMTTEECIKLLKELKKPPKPKSVDVVKRDVGGAEDISTLDSCTESLLTWNDKDGNGHTFYGLAVSLKNIGRPDLGKKLSRMVYKEKADAVKRTFLDDPFQELIHTGSPLLEESPPAYPTPHYVEPVAWTSFHTVAVIFMSILGLGLIVGSFMFFCPKRCAPCGRIYEDIRKWYYIHIAGIDIPEMEKRQSQVTSLKSKRTSQNKLAEAGDSESQETLLGSRHTLVNDIGIITLREGVNPTSGSGDGDKLDRGSVESLTEETLSRGEIEKRCSQDSESIAYTSATSNDKLKEMKERKLGGEGTSDVGGEIDESSSQESLVGSDGTINNGLREMKDNKYGGDESSDRRGEKDESSSQESLVGSDGTINNGLREMKDNKYGGDESSDRRGEINERWSQESLVGSDGTIKNGLREMKENKYGGDESLDLRGEIDERWSQQSTVGSDGTLLDGLREMEEQERQLSFTRIQKKIQNEHDGAVEAQSQVSGSRRNLMDQFGGLGMRVSYASPSRIMRTSELTVSNVEQRNSQLARSNVA